MKKVRPITLGVSLLLLLITPPAQGSSPNAAVEIGGRTLFVLHAGVGSFTAEERAQAVNERLRAILESPLARIEVGVEKSDMGLRVVNAGKPIIAITDADAQAEKVSPDILADRSAAAIRDALSKARSKRSRRHCGDGSSLREPHCRGHFWLS